MSETSRLIKNTGLIAIGNFGAKMISFLLLPMYTSILSTEEYGEYEFIVAISAFLLPIVTLSIHEAMFRLIIDTGSGNEDFKKNVTNAFAIVFFGIVTLAMVILAIDIVIDKMPLGYIFFYVISNCLYVFANNLLRGLGRIKEYTIVSSGKNILQLVLNVLVIGIFRFGMEGLLFSLCISEILAFLVVAYISKIWMYINIKYISADYIKVMLAYSLPLIPNALCAQIINISDRLIINKFLGNSANGIYSVSYKFPNIIDTLYHYFYTAWSESASRVIAKGKEEAGKYYQSLYQMIDNLIFAVIVVLISAMPIMFRIFVRGSYLQGFAYVPILLFAMYFSCIAKFYSGIFTALKKTKVMALSTFAAAFTNVIVNVFLINEWGLYASAVSSLLANIILVLIRKIFLMKEIMLKIRYKDFMVRVVLILVIMALYDYYNWYKIILSMLISITFSLIINMNVVRSVIANVFNRKSMTQNRRN